MLTRTKVPASVDSNGATCGLCGAPGEPWRRKYGFFRAPSWSITSRNLWALDAVAEAGFRYDSSIFPAQNYMCGIRGAPFLAYAHPREFDPESWSLELPLDLRERLIHRLGLAVGASRARALLCARQVGKARDHPRRGQSTIGLGLTFCPSRTTTVTRF